jgi:hypothetical protein
MIGFSGMTQEKYKILKRPGGFVSEEAPTAKIESLAPEIPPELFQAVDKSYPLRAKGLLAAMKKTYADMTPVVTYMLEVDGYAKRLDSRGRRLRLRMGLVSELLPAARRYLTPGYHPSKDPEPRGFAEWLRAHEGRIALSTASEPIRPLLPVMRIFTSRTFYPAPVAGRAGSGTAGRATAAVRRRAGRRPPARRRGAGTAAFATEPWRGKIASRIPPAP